MRKKQNVTISIDTKLWRLVEVAAQRSAKASKTSVVEWCIRKQLGDIEKAIRQKIAYHDRKKKVWETHLKEHLDMRKEDGVGLKWEM